MTLFTMAWTPEIGQRQSPIMMKFSLELIDFSSLANLLDLSWQKTSSSFEYIFTVHGFTFCQHSTEQEYRWTSGGIKDDLNTFTKSGHLKTQIKLHPFWRIVNGSPIGFSNYPFSMTSFPSIMLPIFSKRPGAEIESHCFRLVETDELLSFN